MYNRKTVLLIEDSQDDIAFTRRAIDHSAHDIKLIEITDGQEAIDFLFNTGKYSNRNTSDIHLILLDINIPRISGLDVLKKIKCNKLFSTIPIVILTSSSNRNDIIEAGENGANSYIQKPLTYAKYEQILHNIFSYWFDINKNILNYKSQDLTNNF